MADSERWGGGKEGCPDPPFKNYFDKNRPKLWKHHYLPKFKPQQIVFDKLLIIMYFFMLVDNWYFIGPPPLFQNSGTATVYVGLYKTRGLHEVPYHSPQ